MIEENALIKERIRKLQEIRESGVDPYPYQFEKTHDAKQIIEKYDPIEKEDIGEDEVSVAGRIMQCRKMGKASFFHIQDETEKIQVYIRQNDVGEDQYSLFKKTDIGDIVGIKGSIFKTKTGEVSVYAKNLTLLCKSLRPLPEKFHGIQDQELKYRKRYLDLIMDPETKDLFKKRAKVIQLVRRFLDDIGFLEVDTPVLQTIYGGTNAKPFTTHINAYNMQMYLRVAPELYLKRLMIGGFEKVYEIARNFRNEGVDQTHNPEFSMIEWYEAYVDYHVMMDRAEAMIKMIAKEVNGSEQLGVLEESIDIDYEWPRLSMTDAIKQYLDIDVTTMSLDDLQTYSDKKGITVRGTETVGSLTFAIFDKLVCEQLLKPIWIIDYPKEVSPLSKPHRDKPDLVERYELYIGGKEICDGWSELNDPEVQRDRFEKEQAAIRSGDDEAHPMDDDFIEALEFGLPVCGGIGMGIDRLVMLITNTWSIRDVLFFPTMKPIVSES
ncbi:MAG: lysine--tRNA ligase [Deltaproteobacteria bacterium]|nr:lysine--tRNA ligase [Deltaproteobacteria bacterium]